MKIKHKKELYIYFGIVLLFLIMRLPLLFSYGMYVSGDEAVVGIMAKHIMEGKQGSLFFYNQAYGGGHSIEAYIAAFLFSLFGVKGFLLKSIPLFFSLLVVLFSYYFLNNYFKKKIALISSALLLFFGAFLEPSFTANGYLETMFFCLISMFLFFRIFFDGKKDYKTLVLFGLVLGIAYWSFETSLFFLVTYLVFFFIRDKLFFLKKDFLIWFFSFLAASLPMLIMLVNNKFLNFRDISQNNNILINFFINFKNLFATELPYFHGINNIHNFGEVFVTNWVVYGLALISFFGLVYLNRNGLRLMFLLKKKNHRITKIKKETIFIIFIVIYILFYCFSAFAGVAPRYFVPLMPYCIFLIAIFLVRSNKKHIYFIFLILLLIIGVSDSLRLYQKGYVTDGIINTGYATSSKIIDFLKKEDINNVYTTYFLKWRIIFESNEDIIASCNYLCPCRYRYAPYEEDVEKADNFAYVFHNSSVFNKIFKEAFDRYNSTYKIKKIDDKIVFYGFSKPLRPNFIKKCGWLNAFQ